jgi:DNA-binding MarR family transcriptional regulator
LREVSRRQGITVGALARAVRLSQPTVSGILERLQRQQFVSRKPSPDDRRAMLVEVTEKGSKVLENDPSLLQDRFREELARIEEWERLWILSALERIAAMMDAEAIDAAPMLVTGPITAPAGSAATAQTASTNDVTNPSKRRQGGKREPRGQAGS